ncbi:hypothetical protein R1sor_012458 [Riccia sorocarpa]|uniref:Uncharacterized protein n=1 Tax=Riccia sorocarpa TaxID=122646 RepID=A0ABD3I7V6_9MARC
MVYTTPWEPGFDTSKVLAKKMACWLDLVDVDPLLEGESLNLLQTFGDVIQSAGTTERFESKFANCHERGHIARVCPLTTTTTVLQPRSTETVDGEGYTEVARKDNHKNPPSKPAERQLAPANIYEVLMSEDDDPGEITVVAQKGEADQTTAKGSTSKTSGMGGEMDNPAASAHTPQELNRPQNRAQADPAKEVAPRALSLDESHQVRDHIIEQNRLEKEKKKERKIEKKRAARKK